MVSDKKTHPSQIWSVFSISMTMSHHSRPISLAFCHFLLPPKHTFHTATRIIFLKCEPNHIASVIHTFRWSSIALKIKSNSFLWLLSFIPPDLDFRMQLILYHILSDQIHTYFLLVFWTVDTFYYLLPLQALVLSLNIWLILYFSLYLSLNISSLKKHFLGSQSKVTPPSLSILSYLVLIGVHLARTAATS